MGQTKKIYRAAFKTFLSKKDGILLYRKRIHVEGIMVCVLKTHIPGLRVMVTGHEYKEAPDPLSPQSCMTSIVLLLQFL